MNRWNESQLVWKIKKLFTFFVMLAVVWRLLWLPLSPGEESIALSIVAGAWMLSYKLMPQE